MATTHVWLNYDLGIQGDYTGLYTWLDDMEARECGYGAAFFTLDLDDDRDVFAVLRRELEEAVELTGKARIYVCYLRGGGKMRAGFVVGRRKMAPWEGYAASDDNEDDINNENDR